MVVRMQTSMNKGLYAVRRSRGRDERSGIIITIAIIVIAAISE